MVIQQWAWAPSEPPPAPLPAHARQEPASGPMHLPSPLPGRPWHRATQLLPSPPSSHYIKDNSPGHSIKTVSTAIPIAHSALGLRYFFVKVSPPATGCLFVHCLSPTPPHGNVGSVTEGPCTSAHCAQCTAQGLGHAKCSVNTD